MGAKGLARAKIDKDGNWTQSPLAKTITPEMRAAINKARSAGKTTIDPKGVEQEDLINLLITPA